MPQSKKQPPVTHSYQRSIRIHGDDSKMFMDAEKEEGAKHLGTQGFEEKESRKGLTNAKLKMVWQVTRGY